MNGLVGTDVLVLCYHAVSDDWNDALAVRPDALADQVSGLLARGYVPSTFARAVTDPPAERTVVVTFDDACMSVRSRALPVLDALGVPGTVFVPTAWVGVGVPMRWPGIERQAAGEHAAELRCLDWDDLRALRVGGWEIGSHTVTHPRLTVLGDDGLALELERSRTTLATGLGFEVESVAYPYGDVDGRVEAAARNAGYVAGAGLPARPHAARTLRWPRVGVYRRDAAARFRTKVAPAVRRGRRLVGR